MLALVIPKRQRPDKCVDCAEIRVGPLTERFWQAAQTRFFSTAAHFPTVVLIGGALSSRREISHPADHLWLGQPDTVQCYRISTPCLSLLRPECHGKSLASASMIMWHGPVIAAAALTFVFVRQIQPCCTPGLGGPRPLAMRRQQRRSLARALLRPRGPKP